jgi:Fe-S-cluster containining protein
MKPLAKVLDDIEQRADVFLKLLRRAVPKVTVATENPPLSCLKCASFCCKLAGYVEVGRADIRRLAEYLGLTVPEFEKKHIVEVTRKGEKLIKSGYDTCQFLSADRRCTVYAARPTDCRQYICWDQHDSTVYDFAYFYQKAIAAQKAAEAKRHREEEAEKKRARERAARRRKRQRARR